MPDEELVDAINEAIIQSLYEQDQNEEEEQMLREVMKLSALEHQKKTGLLSTDHLKKKNQVQKLNNNINPIAAPLSVKNPGENNRILLNEVALKKPLEGKKALPPVEIGGKKKNLVLGNQGGGEAMVLMSSIDF